MDVIFGQFKTWKKGNITIVKSDLNRSTLEKFGVIAGIFIAILVILGIIAYFAPATWFGFIDFIVAAVLTYLLLKKFSIDILGVKILTIDKSAGKVVSNVDNFTITIADITNIAIIEQSLQKNNEEKKVYQINFHGLTPRGISRVQA
jgi:hypothetical protein